MVRKTHPTLSNDAPYVIGFQAVQVCVISPVGCIPCTINEICGGDRLK